jgi:hypothetical protein
MFFSSVPAVSAVDCRKTTIPLTNPDHKLGLDLAGRALGSFLATPLMTNGLSFLWLRIPKVMIFSRLLRQVLFQENSLGSVPERVIPRFTAPTALFFTVKLMGVAVPRS